MSHIIGGLIALALGVLGIIGWWENFGDFLRGSVPLFLLIGGLVAVSSGLQLKGQKSKK
ncbi:MAG: hypothetical protein ACI9CF_000607 [Candidatus Omnitrophota bacterium]|jgi:hypothetical protein